MMNSVSVMNNEQSAEIDCIVALIVYTILQVLQKMAFKLTVLIFIIS